MAIDPETRHDLDVEPERDFDRAVDALREAARGGERNGSFWQQKTATWVVLSVAAFLGMMFGTDFLEKPNEIQEELRDHIKRSEAAIEDIDDKQIRMINNFENFVETRKPFDQEVREFMRAGNRFTETDGQRIADKLRDLETRIQQSDFDRKETLAELRRMRERVDRIEDEDRNLQGQLNRLEQILTGYGPPESGQPGATSR